VTNGIYRWLARKPLPLSPGAVSNTDPFKVDNDEHEGCSNATEPPSSKHILPAGANAARGSERASARCLRAFSLPSVFAL
jgi:hypothetical protein